MFDKIMNFGVGGAHEILSHHGLNYPIMLHHTSRNVTPPPTPPNHTHTHPTFFNGFDVVGGTLTDIYMAIL